MNSWKSDWSNIKLQWYDLKPPSSTVSVVLFSSCLSMQCLQNWKVRKHACNTTIAGTPHYWVASFFPCTGNEATIRNDNSHVIMILARVLLQNILTALQNSQPIYSWWSWLFVWPSGPILVSMLLYTSTQKMTLMQRSQLADYAYTVDNQCVVSITFWSMQH